MTDEEWNTVQKSFPRHMAVFKVTEHIPIPLEQRGMTQGDKVVQVIGSPFLTWCKQGAVPTPVIMDPVSLEFVAYEKVELK